MAKRKPKPHPKARPTLALLITGDRKWTDIKAIMRESKVLMKEYNVIIVIHGAAAGADKIGAYVFDTYGITVDPMPADWDQYGKAAGPIRNGQMLKKLLKFKADKKLVLAFHPDLSKSKGTKDMVTQARKAHVDVKVVSK